eukprot:229738-Ditylum_brightwellii.AAC.1
MEMSMVHEVKSDGEDIQHLRYSSTYSFILVKVEYILIHSCSDKQKHRHKKCPDHDNYHTQEG